MQVCRFCLWPGLQVGRKAAGHVRERGQMGATSVSHQLQPQPQGWPAPEAVPFCTSYIPQGPGCLPTHKTSPQIRVGMQWHLALHPTSSTESKPATLPLPSKPCMLLSCAHFHPETSRKGIQEAELLLC